MLLYSNCTFYVQNRKNLRVFIIISLVRPFKDFLINKTVYFISKHYSRKDHLNMRLQRTAFKYRKCAAVWMEV